MLTGEIRLLKWGIIPNQPSFQIGKDQVVGGKENLVVTEIVREPVLDGKSEYHIQCSRKNDKGELLPPFVWKTYFKEPDEIQYFVPNGKYDYLKI